MTLLAVRRNPGLEDHHRCLTIPIVTVPMNQPMVGPTVTRSAVMGGGMMSVAAAGRNRIGEPPLLIPA
jgi:hypothetical protein